MRIAHVTKSFGRTRAVDDVSLDVLPGEILGLVGENGAGKTTLMRIVAGDLAADSGTIELGCRPDEIGFVHQHFLLVNELTIAENLALTARGFITRRALETAAERTIAATGIDLRDVTRRVAELSVGEKSKVELIKAIARRPKILILDEPTSVLAPAEASELFSVMRRLADEGAAVVFISHKIPEVVAVTTRVVVMRRGRIVPGSFTSTTDIARAMVSVESGGSAAALQKEIVAIIGVAGNGQQELATRERERAERQGKRVGVIPEDRTRDGLIAEMTIAENVALREHRWNPREATRRAARLIDVFNIRAQSPRQLAGSLSGGNQQKVILARELERDPDVLIASEPTRGLDIESTHFVHDRLRAAAARGATILLITSDLDEAFALAGTVQVIYRGKLSERMTPEEAAAKAPAMMGGLA